MSLLSVNALSHGYLHQPPVLNGITFTLQAGETVALLGRSGCGKSTLARLLVGLESAAAGQIHWRGIAISSLKKTGRIAFHRDIQLVFQDAIGAVNPRQTVYDIIREPMRHLLKLSRQQQLVRISQMLRVVELDEALLRQRPPQLSGGQLQRVCLARALVVEPKLLILDEAVSNLDLVLQAGIIELLKRLQQQFNTTYLFITHDLRLVERFCQRVMVMENGQIVETVNVQSPLTFLTTAGQQLQKAVLPPFPMRRLPPTEVSTACSA